MVDDAAPSLDWASVNEIRQPDLPTGQNDDSYRAAQGRRRLPGRSDGSIPNNKSDLLNFGAYVEPEVGGPGFLNLFWHRCAGAVRHDADGLRAEPVDDRCGNGVNPTCAPRATC